MTANNSSQLNPLVYSALSLTLGLFFQHFRVIGRYFYGREIFVMIFLPPVILLLAWVALSILWALRIKIPTNRLWLGLAATVWLSLALMSLFDWKEPALYGAVIIPGSALLLATHLAMLESLPGKQLAVRLSNVGFCIFLVVVLGLVLEKITSPATVLWASLISIPLFVAVTMPALLQHHPTPREATGHPSPGAQFLNHLGLILIAAGLFYLPLPFFLSEPSATYQSLFLLTLIFISAILAGCGLAYRGIGRFGAYRHMCQAGLLIVLLVGAATMEYSFFVWVMVGILISYLIGTFLFSLISLWISAKLSHSAVQSITTAFLSLGIGYFLNSIVVYYYGDIDFWLHTCYLIGGMLCLQQLMRRAKSQSLEHAVTQTDWVFPEGSVKGLGKHTFLSRFVRRCARIIAEIFFGRIRIEGVEHLLTPANVILVANHPNTFLDPLIITAFSPGRLHYWAKSTLWKLPILGSILDRMGAIPVFRRQDAGQEPQGDNQLSIALAARKANQGAWLLIFPEGGSHVGLSLKPLKTGTARVAFRALEECQWESDIAIVPVGLDYMEPSLFRTDLTIRIGEPIQVKPLREAYEADPRQAVLDLTDTVTTDLQNLLPHLDSPQLETLVHQVSELYGDHLCRVLGETDPLKARKTISQAVNHYQQLDPDTLLLFSQRLDTYYREKERLATPENHPPIPFKELIRILFSLFSFVTYGIFTNWIPYRLAGRIVGVLSPSPVWMSTAKLSVGAFCFALYYFLWGLLAYRLFGGSVAFLIVASFIVSAFIALGALDRFAFRMNQLKLIWQVFWTQDTNDDLEDMKVSLIQDLERFREAYAFYRSDFNFPQPQEST